MDGREGQIDCRFPVLFQRFILSPREIPGEPLKGDHFQQLDHCRNLACSVSSAIPPEYHYSGQFPGCCAKRATTNSPEGQ